MFYFGWLLPQIMVVLAMVWDRFKNGRVHPAYWIAGVSLIAENLLEVLLFDTPPWQYAANHLASVFL